MTIAAIREVIEAAHYSVRDLQGHTRDEFRRANVPALLCPHKRALRELVIAPRFVRDLERREYVLGALDRQCER